MVVHTQLELENIAKKVRTKLIQMSHHGKTAHLGSALSCVDILVSAYWEFLNIDEKKPNHSTRDRFILSKGHAASALYATLAYRGFFPVEVLDTYAQKGSRLAEHPGPHCVPGVEAATGSLGHGLGLGIGMALSGKIQKEKFRVLVVLGDGECNEGSIWEAAMFAPAHNLENLTVVVDFNRWQATDRSEKVLALQPLKEKWESFGWSAYEVDGHDIAQITSVLKKIPDGSGKPVAIIAHTTKGKGVSFMEDDNNWHYRIPNEEELQAAMEELKQL